MPNQEKSSHKKIRDNSLQMRDIPSENVLDWVHMGSSSEDPPNPEERKHLNLKTPPYLSSSTECARSLGTPSRWKQWLSEETIITLQFKGYQSQTILKSWSESVSLKTSKLLQIGSPLNKPSRF